MLKKLVLLLALLSLAVFSRGVSFTQWFYLSQNFFNNSFSPVVIPGSVSNNSAGFYVDFFNPFKENATFNVFIGGDNQVFSKGFNFSRNVTLGFLEHFRLNATLSPEGVLGSRGYFLVVRLLSVDKVSSNSSVLVYFLFENPSPKNFFNTDYTPVIINNANSLGVYVDFFNPFHNASNFSITASNVEGSTAFQEQNFNVSLNFLQHAKFNLTLTPNQNPSITQNFEVWISVYDLTNEKLVARGLLSISGIALPPSKQKSVFQVAQESFSLWFLALITFLACFFLVFSLWDYFLTLKNLRSGCGWVKKKIKAMIFLLWSRCKSLFKDFWRVSVAYKTMKVLVVLTVVLLLLQSLNVIQGFSLWVLLVLLLILGVFLSIERKNY